MNVTMHIYTYNTLTSSLKSLLLQLHPGNLQKRSILQNHTNLLNLQVVNILLLLTFIKQKLTFDAAHTSLFHVLPKENYFFR